MPLIWKDFHTVNQGYFDFGGNFDHLSYTMITIKIPFIARLCKVNGAMA